jgi:hypothetical protein
MLRGHYAYYALPETSGHCSGSIGPWSALLAQNVEQPKLEEHDLVEVLSSDQGTDSAVATQAVSPVCGATSYHRAVNQLLDERSAGNPHAAFCGSRGG